MLLFAENARDVHRCQFDFTKKHLAAGLCPDLLKKLSVPPDFLAGFGGRDSGLEFCTGPVFQCRSRPVPANICPGPVPLPLS